MFVGRRHAADGEERVEVIVPRGEDAAIAPVGARARLPPLLDQLGVGLVVHHRGRGVRRLNQDPIPRGQGVPDPVLVHVREVVAQPVRPSSSELVAADVSALSQTLQRTVAVGTYTQRPENLQGAVDAEIPP